MTDTITRSCDRCHADVPRGTGLRLLTDERRYRVYDLCAKCTETFTAWIVKNAPPEGG